MPTSFESSFPTELIQQQPATLADSNDDVNSRTRGYIVAWRNQLRTMRLNKRRIWDECWELYRGKDDFRHKQDWQTKIVIPKSWSSVKQATNIVKRLLGAAKDTWTIESVNQNNLIEVLRAEQMTELTKLFLRKAYYLDEFTEGLESGFIMGLGVWKLWWGLVPRQRVRVENQFVPVQAPDTQQPGSLLSPDWETRSMSVPFAQQHHQYSEQDQSQYPSQLQQEALNPQGWGAGANGQFAPQQYLQLQKQLVKEQILEGQLRLRAVDPYNFYWLPGSKLNRWTGTIEDIELPKWELLEMAKYGIFDEETVRSIQPMKLDEYQRKSQLRWDEPVTLVNGPTKDTGVVKITEYFGPVIIDGEVVEEHAHVVLANDSTILVNHKNPFLHQKPPYVAYSPLSLPFRTEGVGLIEPVRAIDKALSELMNLGVDTLLFRLMPLFEVVPEAYENPEDLETGMVPGKIMRRSLGHAGVEGIKPIQFEDISQGAIQVSAALDRSHQEGAMISEIQQGMPRYRGVQTATETQFLQQNQESFMGAMAADIERQALEPMIQMAMDLIFQFIDTANDPRIASILGVNGQVISGMTKEEIMEMIQGDYEVKAKGLTGQLQKAEMLQNLIQFMNLLGQNPEAWMPYINQDSLLRRILEAFRPTIHDIEDIVADPATAQAREAAAHEKELMQMIPQIVQAAQQGQVQQHDVALQQQQQMHEQGMQQREQAMQQSAQQHDQQMQNQQLAQQLQLAKMAKDAQPSQKG